MPQFRALVRIERDPSISITAIAEHLALSLSTASRLITGLVERGFLERETAPIDRRQAHVSITAKGAAVLQSARKLTLVDLEAVFASLNSRKLKTVIEGMQILRELFGSGVGETANGSGKDDNNGRGKAPNRTAYDVSKEMNQRRQNRTRLPFLSDKQPAERSPRVATGFSLWNQTDPTPVRFETCISACRMSNAPRPSQNVSAGLSRWLFWRPLEPVFTSSGSGEKRRPRTPIKPPVMRVAAESCPLSRPPRARAIFRFISMALERSPLSISLPYGRVAGQIMRIDFTEGQDVKENDLLFEIDPRPFEVALEQAEGQLGRDQAALNNAQVDLTRYQSAGASVAQQQLDTAMATVREDEAIVKSDQAGIDSAKLNLVYCKITSPIDGASA